MPRYAFENLDIYFEKSVPTDDRLSELCSDGKTRSFIKPAGMVLYGPFATEEEAFDALYKIVNYRPPFEFRYPFI